MYEFNSEEVNIEKIVEDVAPVEEKPEKRSHSRAGCDCQLAVSILFSFHMEHFKISSGYEVRKMFIKKI